MCVQSVISDYFGQRTYWTSQQFKDVKDLLDHAAKIDRALGEPECIDPEKEEWMKKVEERLAVLEGSS